MYAALYRPPLALVNDLYQLTMAYGYWREGKADQPAVFQLTLRRPPFGGGFAVVAGTGLIAGFLDRFRFAEEDRAYLASLTGVDEGPLFDEQFLEMLADFRPRVEVAAMPEGTVAFGREPILRVEGPLMHGQLLETPLLNLIGFQSLIATKAARICHVAAAGQPVVDFGLRRAHGIDGGVSASRAAHLGGCSATSNLLAGRLFEIPVSGTHAHSWVLAFESEEEAFDAFARAQPNNAVFLLDTFDTLQGLQRAIRAARRLRKTGDGRLLAVRLDSGDLGALAREVRARLDQAELEDVRIIASSDLDEHKIAALRAEGDCAIDLWGVGTQLVTGHDDPSFAGAYKLSSIGSGAERRGVMKLSEDDFKTSDPGRLQVRRLRRNGAWVRDVVYDLDREPDAAGEPGWGEGEDLLAPLGDDDAGPAALATARDRARRQLAAAPAGVLRLRRPDRHPVVVDPSVARDRALRRAGEPSA